ncbi:MAG TPA: SGNH/GDSL hydrolase family protein, partial [Rhodoglobus sp.]|nr:SGNH/GDSL hydrolase family protein [Rhodoglobus sp.]
MRRLVGVGLVVGALLLSAPPASADEPLEYVALGDSYSAGFGLLPVAGDEPASGCYQAAQNYPHRVALALGLQLKDVTCSGAVTANIRDTPQVTITGAGTAAVQSDALSASTDIVTVTIGGNDLGFSSVAARCLTDSASGPPLSLPGFANCKDYYNPVPGVDQLIYTLDTAVTPALQQTFALIRQKAPNARVFVVGYPTIAPDFAQIPPSGCFSSPFGSGTPPYPENTFPYTQTDTLYLHHIEHELDDAIQTAAADHGFTFIPTWDATQTHSACSSDPYIWGITLTQNAADGTPTGLPGLYVKLGALHPDQDGVAFLSSQVESAIRGHLEAEAAATAAARPQLAATGAGADWLPAACMLV